MSIATIEQSAVKTYKKRLKVTERRNSIGAQGYSGARGNARSLRPRDQANFDRIAPLLHSGVRVWLRDALARMEPGHT
jgi:hypothetical protein